MYMVADEIVFRKLEGEANRSWTMSNKINLLRIKQTEKQGK
jgi:hypothetical protein